MANDFKSWVDTKLQIAALVAAILAIAITTIFSLRAERTKEITLTYLSKRSLVSVERPSSKVGLEILYGGKAIASPWLVLVKFENSGNVPIEERDIEAQAKLSFEKGKAIAVDISSKSQPDLFAKIHLKGSDVEIEHKLLNPGDWITFDILIDGEPELPPKLLFRVSGVSNPLQIVSSSEAKPTHSALISMPLPAIIFINFISALFAILMIMFSITLLQDFIKAFPRFTRHNASNLLEIALKEPFNLEPKSRLARTIYTAIGEPKFTELLTKSENIFNSLNALPEEFFKSLNLTINEASDLLQRELMESFHQKIKNFITSDSPKEHLDVIDNKFNLLDIGKLSFQQFVDEARKINDEKIHYIQNKKTDFSDLYGSFSILFIGICLILSVGGNLRVFLLDSTLFK